MYISCDHNNTFLAGCIHSMHVWIYDGVFVIAAGPLERVYLSAPIVAIRGKEANLTAVVWPSHTRTLTFFWWFDNSSEVRRFSSSTSSHHSSIHTRHLCFLLLLFSHLPTPLLMSLCSCLQSKSVNHHRFSHKSCKKWQHVTALCHSGGSSLDGWLYLSIRLIVFSAASPHYTVDIRSVLYSAMRMQLFLCISLCFSFWNPAHYNLGGKHLTHISERRKNQGHGPGCFWEHCNAGFKSYNC